ncbi:MAG: hypothetical protein RPR97_01930 [Colwellia sp.]|jgi:hypothetical protein
MTLGLPKKIKQYAFNIQKDILGKYGFVQNKSNFDFLFTCSNGLYHYQLGKINKLLKGNYFGVTELPNKLYLAIKYVQNGTDDERSFAETFNIEKGIIKNKKQFNFKTIDGEIKVPVRVHQIVYNNDIIWVTNTRQNLIWKCNTQGMILKEFCYSKPFDYEPDSTCTDIVRNKARNSIDYHHFNSIYINEKCLYILAHNSAGLDKSQNSFYLKLDHDFNILDRVNNVGKACHNLVHYNDDFYICDSANGQVVHLTSPNVQLGYFLRGMALQNNNLIVGGTVSSEDVNLRGKGDSRIFFIPAGASHPSSSISLGRTGDIHDICALDNQSYSS